MTEGRSARIAVLASGGDAPGMNACLRAVVRAGRRAGLEVLGVRRGYAGLIAGDMAPLERQDVGNIIQRGGIVLGTARCEDFRTVEGRARAGRALRDVGAEALVVMGGDGSYRGALALAQEIGVCCLGIPASIDNDVYGTDFSIGFDTAVNTALESIDRIRDTADASERPFFVEVMGRASGAIALEVALAGGADGVVVPETPTDVDALCRLLQEGFRKGKRSHIVVVAEGDEAGGALALARRVGERIKSEHRVVVLGHVQRGGSPTARDRVLASKLGAAAVDALLAGEANQAVGEIGGRVRLTPLQEAAERKKQTDRALLDLAYRLSR
jgi:6-phosphofructokinase 1